MAVGQVQNRLPDEDVLLKRRLRYYYLRPGATGRIEESAAEKR
jgi:hypothetical protein